MGKRRSKFKEEQRKRDISQPTFKRSEPDLKRTKACNGYPLSGRRQKPEVTGGPALGTTFRKRSTS